MEPTPRHHSDNDHLLTMYGIISNSGQVSGNANIQQNSANHRSFLGSTSNCAATTHSLATTQALPQQQPKSDYTSMTSTRGAKTPTQLHQMNSSQGNIQNPGMTARDFEEINRISSDIIHNNHYPANSLHPMSESGNDNHVHMKSNPMGTDMNSRMPYINTSSAMPGSLPQSQAQVALLEVLHNMEKDSSCDFSAASSLVQTFSTFLQQQQQQQQQHHVQTDNNNNNCQVPSWQQQMNANAPDNPPNVVNNQQGFNHPQSQTNAMVTHDNYNRVAQVPNPHHIGNTVQQSRPPQAHLQDYNRVHGTHNQINQNAHQGRINDSPKPYNNAGNLNNQSQGNSLQTIDMHEFKRTNIPSGANNAMNVRAGGQAYMKSGYGNLRHMSHDADKTHNQVTAQNRTEETFSGDNRLKEKKLTRTPIPSDAEKTSTSSGSGAETSPHHYGEQIESLPAHGNNVFELDFMGDQAQNKSVNMYSQQGCVNNVPYSRSGDVTKDYANRYGNMQPSFNPQNAKSSSLVNMLSNNPELRNNNTKTSMNTYPQTKTTLSNIQHSEMQRFQQSSTADTINKSFPTVNMNQELQHVRPTQGTSNKEAINCYEGIKQSGLMTDIDRVGRIMSANHNNNANVKPNGEHDGAPSASNNIVIDGASFDSSPGMANDRNKQKKNRRNKVNGKSSKINDGMTNESNNFVPRLNVQVTSRIPKATADPITKAQTYALVKDHLTNEQLRLKERETRRQPKKPKGSKTPDVNIEGVTRNANMIALSKPTTIAPPDPSKSGSGVRQWQTVTAVQVPKLPPVLSEQDRIPKRGRPPKKMVQQNLRVSKPKVVDHQKVVIPNKPVDKTQQQGVPKAGKLVSMYTINDHGYMEEITPKLKENKRSKERSVAFMNYLNEIRTSQKHKFGESCSSPGNESNSKQQKNRKKSKPRTRVFGKNPAPMTLSGFKETMCTFSELAAQYKISNSILSRATENLRKSAAASVARQRLNSTSSDKLDSFDKLISKPTSTPEVNSQSHASITASQIWSEWSSNTTVQTPAIAPANIHNTPQFTSAHTKASPVVLSPPLPDVSPTPVETPQRNRHEEQYQDKSHDVQHEKIKMKQKKKNKKNKKKLIIETQSLGKKKKEGKSHQKHKSSLDTASKNKQDLEPRQERSLVSSNHDISFAEDQPEDAYDAGDSLSETESNSAPKFSYQSYHSKSTAGTSSTSLTSTQSNLSFKTAVFPTQSPFQDARESLMQSKKMKEDAQVEEPTVVSTSMRGKKHKHKRKSKFQRKSKNNLDPKFIAIMDALMESFNSDLKISLQNLSQSSKSSINASTNVFSVQRAQEELNDDILWQQNPETNAPVSVPNKSALYSTSSKTTTVKYTNGTSEPSINTSNVLMSSISSKKSPDKNHPSTMSTFCTMPFYQKYGYVRIPSNQPTPSSSHKSNAKVIHDTSANKPDKSTPSQTESSKASRKRKRGWPLGKKRGGKKSNYSSDHDSENPPTPKTIETEPEVEIIQEKVKSKESSKQKSSSNANKSKSIKEKVSVNETVSSKDANSTTNNKSPPNLDQIKSQIQQAIQSSLSAVPNINADEISKAVNAAIQNYMANNPTTSKTDDNQSSKEETKGSKPPKTKRQKAKSSAEVTEKMEEENESAHKAHTEKHPKKVWAWKHKDASIDIPNSSSSVTPKQRSTKKKLGRPRKHPIVPSVDVNETISSKVRKTSKTFEKSNSDDFNCVKLSLLHAKQAVSPISNVSAAAKQLSKTKYSFREPGMYDNTDIGKHMKSAIDDVVECAVSDPGMLGYYSDDEDTLLQRLLNESIKQPNDKVSSTAKKSLESVVEKLKSKQAQSLQNAAAALLQLQQGGPVCNDGKFNTVSGKKTLADIKALKRRAHKLMKAENASRYNKYHTNHENKLIKHKGRGRPKKIKPTITSATLHGISEASAKKRGRISKKNLLPKKTAIVEREFQQEDIVTSVIPPVLPQKSFLTSGLYSTDHKVESILLQESNDAERTGCVLPTPLHAGLYLRNSLLDFQLPYDIWWMYRKRKINASQDPSTQFQVINKNVYSCAKPTQDTEDHICECDPLSSTTLCGKNCLNRVVYTECSTKTCPNKERCTNQAMQRKQWCTSLQRFKTKDKGWGIQTNENIAEGSFILEYVGEVVSESEFRRRTVEHYHAYRDHYCVNLDNTHVIDGYRMGNEGRFVNHSCEPNCEMQKWLVDGEHRLGLFARRLLHVGEELTYDYNFHAYNVNQQQECRCGTGKCRGIITGRRRRSSQDNNETANSAKLQPRKTASSSHDVALWMVKPNQQNMTCGVQYNSFKPPNEAEKHIIQSTSLFLIRNIRQVQKSEINPLESVKYHTQLDVKHVSLPATSISTRRVQNNTPVVPDLDRSAKLKTVLDEIFDAVVNCEDENGNTVDIPIIANDTDTNSDDEESNKDFNKIKQKIADNYFDDLDAFGNYVMQTIKNIEKHFGKKSAEGRSLPIMRKTYSSARSMAEVLIADDFGGRRKSIRNAIRECEFDERKNEDFIRCICQIYKDEGVMVQCESCYVWQHCDCMGVKPDKVDKYLCEKCYPRKVPCEVRVIPQPSNAHPGHTYYITLMHGNMLIKQGDCVYLSRANDNSTISSTTTETDKLNIFRIEKLWTDESGSKFAYGHHFLRPHETHHSPSRTFYHNELFVSPLDEIIPLNAIVRTCCIMDLYTYCKGKPRGFGMSDLYVCDFRVDKTARIFTRITKKKHNVCTKPHVFDTYHVKLCPKKDLRPHQIPEQYKKLHRSTDSLDECNRTSSFEEDEPASNHEEDVQQDNSDENEDGKNKKKDRLNNIAKKLLSRLPRQAVDMSYLLEPGNGKRQRKKTLVSMESLGQQ